MFQATAKRETYIFLRREERTTLETTNLSSRLYAWKDHGTDSPSNCSEVLGEQGSDLGQPAQLHQG